MRTDEFETLTMRDFQNVMKPLQRDRILKNYIDVAFDSEFYVKKGKWDEKNGMFEVLESTCVSVQFALSETVKGIYYPLKAKITWSELLDYTLDFFRVHDVTVPATKSGKKHIYYIVFYGYAELSQISDFRDEETDIQLYSNKSIACKREIKTESGEVYVLHMIDLRGYFKGSLASVGSTVGIEKMEIKAGGLEHEYWITRMLELHERFPREFELYALRDVEITIKVWDSLKARGFDPHNYPTLAGLAMAEFRADLNDYLVSYKVTQEKFARKVDVNAHGEDVYKTYKRKRIIFNGDWNVRRYACLSYAGGNNQAFVRGYYSGLNAKFFDFVSLYIAAAMIQPLPNLNTDWRKLNLADIESYEGFANVKFKFPDNEMYPCLPIQLGILNSLMFPLSGETWCTLSELRQALAHDVQLTDFSGYGFKPSEGEREHKLKPFFDKLLKKKNTLKGVAGKEIEYAMIKGMLVDVIGKLMVRSKKYNLKKIGKFMNDMQDPAAFRKIAMSKVSREFYESRGAVGPTWSPEWASLILGNARACVSEVLHDSAARCMFISTDGGVWDGTPNFLTQPTPLLAKMIAVGGGIHAEGKGDGSVDELWISGNRLYSTWFKGKLVKFARMGCAIHDENFENFLRRSFALGKQADETAERKILTGMFLYDFRDVPINSELVQDIKLSFKDDNKRIILNPDVNIWREHSDTKPYESLDAAFNHYYGIKATGRPPKPAKPAGRPRAELSASDINTILHGDASLETLSKTFHVSVSTIKRIKVSSK